MARIPKLDAAGKFLAADVNAQIDARAKAATAPLLDGKRGVEATELGTEHLDTVTTPGTYTQSANLEATLETGYPMTRGGVLQVERSVSKTMVWQTYTTYAPSPSTPAQTWQRGSYNGTWTPWARVGGGVDGSVPIFPTLAEAQAWEVANPGKRALTLEPSTPDTTAPTWNATLSVSTPNGGTAVVTASALAADDRIVAGYKYSLDAGATWAAVSPSADRKFTITGLKSETAYSSVFLRAEDASGNATALAVPTFTTPVTLAPAPADFAYQWLGSSLSGTSWTDAKAGLTLTLTLTLKGATPATASGDSAVFAGGGGYAGTGAAMTSKEAAYVVVSKLATLEDVGSFLFGANDNASRVITSPDFGVANRLYGSWKNTGGVIGLDTKWHVAVFRWSATPALNDMWVDGLRYNMTPRNDASVVNPATLRIGGDAANNYKGSIREVQMFNRYVSDGEAKSIIADLRTKYGIA